MAAAWLLRPGDPLPPLCLQSGPWTADAFAGHWGLIVVAQDAAAAGLAAIPAGARALAIASPGSAVPMDALADHGTVSAQRLGALVAQGRVVPVAVVIDPGGTVAFAAQGSSAESAARQALCWLQSRLPSPGQA
ncbi:MAG: hypothetical protein FJ100_02595 [Deltaproteobacteria bacterium]|nr:hypothetical protein [Deltaproteobacteria bacterium]